MRRLMVALVWLLLCSASVSAEELCGVGGCCCPPEHCSCGHEPKLEAGCGCQVSPVLPPSQRGGPEDFPVALTSGMILPAAPWTRALTQTQPQPSEWAQAPPSPPPRTIS